MTTPSACFVLFFSILCCVSCNFTTTVKTDPKMKVPLNQFNAEMKAYANCKNVKTYGRVTKDNKSQLSVLCLDLQFDKMPNRQSIDSIGMNIASSVEALAVEGAHYTRYEIRFFEEKKDGIVTTTSSETRFYYPQLQVQKRNDN
jgi:hypothetical protein